MWISFEGINCSGKTTIQHAIHEQLPHIKILGHPSISFFSNKYPQTKSEEIYANLQRLRRCSNLRSPEAELEHQQKWFDITQARIDVIESIAKKQTIISHGCTASLFAHNFAIFSAYPKLQKIFLERFAQWHAQQPYPSLLVIFWITPETFAQRLVERGIPCAQWLISPWYRSLYLEGLLRYAQCLENRFIIVSGEHKKEYLVAQIQQFLTMPVTKKKPISCTRSPLSEENQCLVEEWSRTDRFFQVDWFPEQLSPAPVQWWKR